MLEQCCNYSKQFKGALFWENPKMDLWSQIIWILHYQKNRKIRKKDHLSWQRHVLVLLVGRKQHTDLCGEDKKKNKSNISYVWIYEMFIQRIQVERLMTSNIAFVTTVDWLRCKANYQTLLGGDDIVLSEKRPVVLSICVSWRLKSR